LFQHLGRRVGCLNFLIAFLNDFDIEKESINAYINKKKIPSCLFYSRFRKIPFKIIDDKLKEVFSDFPLDRDRNEFYKITFSKRSL
jgi:hypothetical protein